MWTDKRVNEPNPRKEGRMESITAADKVCQRCGLRLHTLEALMLLLTWLPPKPTGRGLLFASLMWLLRWGPIMTWRGRWGLYPPIFSQTRQPSLSGEGERKAIKNYFKKYHHPPVLTLGSSAKITPGAGSNASVLSPQTPPEWVKGRPMAYIMYLLIRNVSFTPLLWSKYMGGFSPHAWTPILSPQTPCEVIRPKNSNWPTQGVSGQLRNFKRHTNNL